eukprot:1440982-Pyramimonas_sp.AAC.1
MGAAVTNFHLAGAAPQFAQRGGGKKHCTPVAAWPLGLLGLLGASWGRLRPSWGASAPFRPR